MTIPTRNEYPTTNTYYAKSAFSDSTNVAAAIATALGVLSDPNVAALIPLDWLPTVLAVSGALTVGLRTFNAVRPVAAIPPGRTKPVEVQRLERHPAP